MLWNKIKSLWKYFVSNEDGFVGEALALYGVGQSIFSALNKPKDRGLNPRLEAAIKSVEASTGQNLFNRLQASGTRRIATSKASSIEEARGIIGRDPGLLREVLDDIGRRSATQASDLSDRIETKKLQFEEDRRKKLLEIGIALEKMEETKRLEKEDLRTTMIGTGLSLAGQGISSLSEKRALDELLKRFLEEDEFELIGNEVGERFA